MPYNVKKSSGSILATVQDRQIDKSTTSVALVGYSATSYGLDHAENFLHLMENFAHVTPPANPLTGQFWYDTSTKTMKVYQNGTWVGITGTPSVGGDPSTGGISGIFHCPIDAEATSVLLLFSGGKIVAVVASKDIPQSSLPATVTVNTEEYAFAALFAFGLQGGVNLADNDDVSAADDHVFSGRVPLAEQAHFSGGGVDDTEVSGWGYIDIGAGKSIAVMVSCGQIIAAVSSAHILNSDLPVSATFYVKKERDTVGSGQPTTLESGVNSVTCQVRSRFPGQPFKQWTVDGNGNPTFDPAQTINNVGLFPGLTFAAAVGVTGGVSQTINSLISSQTSATGTAIATASQQLKTWVDANSATALKLTELQSTFQSATGTTSMASAVNSLISTASDSSAITTAITNLKSEFRTALGTNSFAEALSKMTSTATASGATAHDITTLTTTFTNKFGGTTFAQAIDNLYTSVDDMGGEVAGWGLTLNSNGYITGVEAFNGGAAHNYFKVTTSNFILADNNIDFIPFQVKNGVVYIKNAMIGDLTIGGDKIKNNSLSAMAATNIPYNGYYKASFGTSGPNAMLGYYVVGQEIGKPLYVELITPKGGDEDYAYYDANLRSRFGDDDLGFVCTYGYNSLLMTMSFCFIAERRGDGDDPITFNAHRRVSVRDVNTGEWSPWIASYEGSGTFGAPGGNTGIKHSNSSVLDYRDNFLDIHGTNSGEQSIGTETNNFAIKVSSGRRPYVFQFHDDHPPTNTRVRYYISWKRESGQNFPVLYDAHLTALVTRR